MQSGRAPNRSHIIGQQFRGGGCQVPLRYALDHRPPDFRSFLDAVDPDEPELPEEPFERDAWSVIAPEPVAAPPLIAFVDGVQMRNARFSAWDEEGIGAGVLSSFAAGAVIPALDDPFHEIRVRRVCMAAAAKQPPLINAGPPGRTFHFEPRATSSPSLEAIGADESQVRQELETDVAHAIERQHGIGLLVIDGRLPPHIRPGAVGLIKTLHAQPVAGAVDVLASLAPGTRSDMRVRVRSQRRYYSWYVGLRARKPYEAPLSNIARMELEDSVPRDEAIRIADLTASVLHRYAPETYQDRRSPQNLLPVAGLERRLRHEMGDPAYLFRLLQDAFSRQERAS
jgi:hypothetical protein